jgi:hypothetical protein
VIKILSGEERTSNALGHEREAHPGEDLASVVGARHQLEEEAAGDPTDGSTLRTQVAQLDVRDEVAKLEKLRITASEGNAQRL